MIKVSDRSCCLGERSANISGNDMTLGRPAPIARLFCALRACFFWIDIKTEGVYVVHILVR